MSKISRALSIISKKNNKVAIDTLNIINKNNIKISYIKGVKKNGLKNLDGYYLSGSNKIFINSRLSINEMSKTIVHEVNHLDKKIPIYNDLDILHSELLAFKAEIEYNNEILDNNNIGDLVKFIVDNYGLFDKYYTK